jgi:hypothetical protein
MELNRPAGNAQRGSNLLVAFPLQQEFYDFLFAVTQLVQWLHSDSLLWIMDSTDSGRVYRGARLSLLRFDRKEYVAVTLTGFNARKHLTKILGNGVCATVSLI